MSDAIEIQLRTLREALEPFGAAYAVAYTDELVRQLRARDRHDRPPPGPTLRICTASTASKSA